MGNIKYVYLRSGGWTLVPITEWSRDAPALRELPPPSVFRKPCFLHLIRPDWTRQIPVTYESRCRGVMETITSRGEVRFLNYFAY